MNRFEVFVFFLVATVAWFCTGSESYCKKQCCSTEVNETSLNLILEKGNSTNCSKECIQPHGRDINVTLTLQQFCSKQGKNRTKAVAATPSPLYIKIDCQEMFDTASNDFVGLVKGVKVLFNLYHGLWYINITWDKLTDPTISKKWTYYALQYTWNPKVLKESICVLLSKNRTFLVINSTEEGWKYPQPIYLNVSTYPLMKSTGYRYGITVWPTPTSEGVLPTAKETTQISPEMLSVIIVLSSFVGIFLFILMVLFGLKRKAPENVWCGFLGKWNRRTKQRNRIRSSQSENQDQFKFDASILYSSRDEKWVTEELIPLLETEHNFKCFIHFRDFEAGRVIHENMADAVYNCRKNITVVSKNFLKSNYCKDELDMALERVQRYRDCSLIVVNLDGVSSELLPKALRIRTFVNLTNFQEQKTWRNRLVKQISMEEDFKRPKGDTKNVEQGIESLGGKSFGIRDMGHTNDLMSNSTESV